MVDIFAEVDEAMRQERVEKFWKQYGKFVLAFILLTIAGTAVVSGYRAWNDDVKSSQTNQVLTLLDDENFPQNVMDAELNIRPGLKGIALITAAGSFFAEDSTEDALILYEKAAYDISVPLEIRQLAVLMRVRILANNDKIDDSLLTGLEKIWRDDKSPWRYHARLEAAALYANKEGDFEQARAQLSQIINAPGLPKSLYNKAEALNHIYVLKQTDKDS